jgi:hypothetical protein
MPYGHPSRAGPLRPAKSDPLGDKEKFYENKAFGGIFGLDNAGWRCAAFGACVLGGTERRR